MTKRIGIIAALPGELEDLVRGWRKHGKNMWTGQAHEMDCVAIAGGMGAEAASRACEQALATGKLDALVSVGWAGSLTCGLKPGDAVAVYDVLDVRTGERFVSAYPKGQRLITLDHVARADEKRRLAESCKATLVDMEAAAVARIAAARNLAFYCFKGVSDGANDRLPDFGPFIDAKGQLRMAKFLAHIALRPQYWPALKRLNEHSKIAAAALGVLTRESLKQIL
ncbi:nucleoside phosphorylase [Paracidobacterium acidisoli]|uniref:Nucleoside phosphorylase n=1 Tax=Paracidobacterium acidisoli TaxID=2303751 RepID=A0A372IU93_9BACT|nr:nucleoside phosphorylase [Paracidobacterium acidisoli]MBT9329795.1 nucleoside phosphorylase [Paracidobacterium acidisoli]